MSGSTFACEQTKRGNQFQFDTHALMQMLDLQIGVSGHAPLAALRGQWQGPERFCFVLKEVVRDASPFVAIAWCEDGLLLDCTPSFFMRSDVVVQWREADVSRFVTPSMTERDRYVCL